MSKWTKEDLKKALKMLNSQCNSREIAEALGKTSKDVKDKIKTVNWADVEEGGDGNPEAREWSDSEKMELFERRNAGETFTEIGKILRRSGNACSKFYNKVNWDNFIYSQPKDKQPEVRKVVGEIIADKVEKVKEVYQNKLIKELTAKAADREIFLEDIKKVVPVFNIPKTPQVYVGPKGKHVDPEECVLVLSDMQVGQWVHPHHTAGIGSYDKKLFVSRMENLKSTISSIVSNKLSTHNLTKLHVLLLGDIVEGKDIFEGQVYHTDMNVGEQVLLASNEISKTLIYLSSLFKEIQVSCIRGNHGRITKNSAPEENYDSLVYHMCKMQCQKFVDSGKMSFLISDSMMEIIDINSWKFLLMHGDGITGGGANPMKAAESMENGQYKMSRGGFQYMIFGHYHRAATLESNTGGEIICNGSWVGGSDLSINKMALSSRPRQAFFGVHKDYGKTWEYMVYLTKGEPGWNNH